MVASDAASAAGLSRTRSEWQGMAWLWCSDADAILIGACPWMRQRGAQSIQDWPTRNAVSVANAASRTSGREGVALMDLLDGLMRSKVARGMDERQRPRPEAVLPFRNLLPVGLEGNAVGVRSAAHSGVEGVDRGDLLRGELEVENVEVLGDAGGFHAPRPPAGGGVGRPRPESDRGASVLPADRAA